MISREMAEVSVGPGWGRLIAEIYDQLPPDVIVTTVKEKFGELRCYVHGAPVEFWDALDEIEERSRTICEACGEPGQVICIRGWYKTSCTSCAES